MLETVESRIHPELKELVVEASRALARLDADRLEELALSCQALNRDLAKAEAPKRADLIDQSRAAEGDIRIFSRVLEATRSNLHVVNRLRALREDRLEYGVEQPQQWMCRGNGHGDN
jgi:hypothetical protein